MEIFKDNIWERIFISEKSLYQKNIQNENCIFFVLKGKINFSLKLVENSIIQAGQIVLIPNHNFASIQAIEDTYIISCCFSSDKILFFNRQIEDRTLFSGKKSGLNTLIMNNSLTDFLVFLETCMKEGITSPDFSELKLKEMFFLLCAYYSKQKLSAFLQPAIGENIQFKKFVLDNFMNTKNVQELAELAHYSTSGFIKRFKTVF